MLRSSIYLLRRNMPGVIYTDCKYTLITAIIVAALRPVHFAEAGYDFDTTTVPVSLNGFRHWYEMRE